MVETLLAPADVIEHGGNLQTLMRRYEHAPTPWVDASTCINPYPYPLRELPSSWFTRLPEEQDIERLLQTATEHYGTGDIRLISAGAGMQTLMSALAAWQCRNNSSSAIYVLTPSYAEHARLWKAAGHRVIPFSDPEEIGENADIVILCNPNNPDGRVWPAEYLLELGERLEEQETLLVLDESFADCAPETSLAPYVTATGNIMVLRSMGKYYGLPGLRVSFSLAPTEITEWIRICTGPWPVSTLGCHICTAALADTAWQQETTARLLEEGETWCNMLGELFPVLGHTPLFTLLEVPLARHAAERLAAAGIATRSFAEQEHWLRVGLPDEQYRPRIIEALERLAE